MRGPGRDRDVDRGSEVGRRGQQPQFAATLQAHGHDELEIRVRTAYEEFIAPGKFTFRARDNAERLADVIKFNWEMISTDGDEVAAVGLEIFFLGADGRIKADYQFIEN
jgi:hypothetical protein